MLFFHFMPFLVLFVLLFLASLLLFFTFLRLVFLWRILLLSMAFIAVALYLLLLNLSCFSGFLFFSYFYESQLIG